MSDIITTSAYGTYGAASIVKDVINATWNYGLQKATDYETKITTATGQITTMLDGDTAPSISASTVAPVPTVTEPTITIPATVEATDVFDQFDTKYLELVALLSDRFAGFITTYFPTEGLAYDAAEDWLVATIDDPDAAAEQIWEDERARLADEAAREAETITAQWAARRFPLPPGAATAQVLAVNQKLQSEVAKSSRTAAIQSIELVKFAVDKALQLRQTALGAAVEYIKALASGPDMASRLVNVGYDAQSKLISAAAQFYGARTEATKLTLSGNQFNATQTQEAAKTNVQSELALIDARIRALLADAAATAQFATSLFNNVHVSAGVSKSASNSVGYSYGGDTSGDGPVITSAPG